MSQLESVLGAIDAANSGDPTFEEGGPAALLYGRRMSDRDAANVAQVLTCADFAAAVTAAIAAPSA